LEKIDSILDGYKEVVAKITTVDTEGLIKYFKLDSDDPAVLEEALKQMWARAGSLEISVVQAVQKGDFKEKAELEAEVREIRRLEIMTHDKIRELKNKA